MHKTTIGIVCAISRLTGETLKRSIESTLAAKHITCPIVMHEQPKESYAAAHSMLGLAHLMLASIDDMLKQLPETELMYIVVSANSVHRAFPELRSLLADAEFAQRVHLLSMIDATVAACQRHQLQKVLLLASSKTVQSGLYHQPLMNHGLTPIDLATQPQALMDTFIAKGVANLSVDEVNTMVSMILQCLHQTRADGVLFGCAELKHRLSEANLHTVIIDSSAALERELVRRLINLDHAWLSIPQQVVTVYCGRSAIMDTACGDKPTDDRTYGRTDEEPLTVAKGVTDSPSEEETIQTGQGGR